MTNDSFIALGSAVVNLNHIVMASASSKGGKLSVRVVFDVTQAERPLGHIFRGEDAITLWTALGGAYQPDAEAE
jgi:hypothetical protein